MKKKRRLFQKHFRINRSKQSHNHPAFVIRKHNDFYDYIGLTHSPFTDNRKNIRLKNNPNPKDKAVSYLRPFFRRDPIKKFSKRILRGWKFSKKDKRRVRRVSRTRK